MKIKRQILAASMSVLAGGVLPWMAFGDSTSSVTNLISRLDPLTANVLSNFVMLTDIPRPTYHEQKVSDALFAWAEERGLNPTQDAMNNVWFDVPATAGMEAMPKVILQGHMDMVAAGFDDPENECVTLDCDETGKIFSKDSKTSIGADDGIGVSMALAVADGKVPHGPVRVLVTTDEEQTETGAIAVPAEIFNGISYLINIDFETDGELTISSAANDAIYVTGSVATKSAVTPTAYCVKIENFRGGHSGQNIANGRLNAILELGRIFTNAVARGVDFELAEFTGGDARNAIPPHAQAIITLDESNKDTLEGLLSTAQTTFRNRGEENATVSLVATNDVTTVLDEAACTNVLKYLTTVHDGVWNMSSKISGLVETSMNHGLIDVSKDGISISGAARGSVENTVQAEEASIGDTAKKCGFDFAVSRSCAPWPANTANPLINIFSNAWKTVTGGEMKVTATHGGLECGWFSQKAPTLNIVSVGPTIENPHTVNETTYTASVSNNIQLLTKVLATLPERHGVFDVTAQQRYPWNGKFDISYTVNGVVEECEERSLRPSLKVLAVERTTHVTNIAEKAYLSGDTAVSDGTHRLVWDMDAQNIFQGLVSTNFEVFVSVEVDKAWYGVQLWENGPYWSECSVGANNPEEFGYYFWWGDIVGYKRNENDDGWVSVEDGTAFEFTKENCPAYSMDVTTLKAEGYIDSTTNLVAAHDAASVHFGSSWRIPTIAELEYLSTNCLFSMVTTNGVPGWLVTGKGDYAANSIFIPNSGDGSRSYHYNAGECCGLWSATSYATVATPSGYSRSFETWDYTVQSRFNTVNAQRYSGYNVRGVRGADGAAYYTFAGILCANGSGAVRADLRTGEVRVTDVTETLTYSTEWEGGDEVTVAVNSETLFQGSGSGTCLWMPLTKGLYEMTHTVVTGGVSVVRTASFMVYDGTVNLPWQIGAGTEDSVVAWTNGMGTLVIEGEGKMMSFGSDGTGVPWPITDVSAVKVGSAVTQIGTNAWYGMSADVAYTVYAPAAATLSDGFGGPLGYVRTKFKAAQSADGIFSMAVALETAPSLTNDWSEITLKDGDAAVDENGRIVIEHATGTQEQGYYIIQSAE